MNTDRIPPQAIDIERTVLGTMLSVPDTVEVVVDLIDESVFYHGGNRKIFICMKEMFRRGMPVDLVTLTEELRNKNILEEVGEEGYLGELAESIATTANIEYYTKILKEKANLRELINVTNEISTECFETENPSEVLNKAESRIYHIAVKATEKSKEVIDANEIMSSTLKEIERMQGGGRIGVTSGFKTLDEKIGGLEGGQLIIIGGRPSTGKTAFVLCEILNQTIVHQIPIAMFSLEMPQVPLGQRFLSIETGIDLFSIRKGFIGTERWKTVSEKAAIIAAAPIYLDQKPGLDIVRLHSAARRLIRERGVQIIYVDHLHLMEHGKEDPTFGVSELSKNLKHLAMDLNIPMVVISHLHRASAKGGKKANHRPSLIDLRQSGSIEQDADMVMFVHREFMYSKKDEDRDKAELLIEKQRNGPIGTVDFNWDAKCTRFYEPDEQTVEEGVW